ncbi:hypothetical protein FRC91_10555 [Bradymonadales bacterium TMQ1]|nr:hypothetical protein FRC91_10555 [Bradymonadales bacterium TMQ1]
MSLPTQLPTFIPIDEATWSREAQRLRDFLKRLERHLEGDAALRIYGSAAVTFYTTADREPSHMTEDIDVGHPGTLGPELQRAFQQAKAEGADISLHLRPPGLWLAANDWPDHCIDISRPLQLNSLLIILMHPYDLIISKMVRWNERDAADVELLQSRFTCEPSVFGARLNQAVHSSMVTDWQKEQLADILEEIFVDETELQSAREAATSLIF